MMGLEIAIKRVVSYTQIKLRLSQQAKASGGGGTSQRRARGVWGCGERVTKCHAVPILVYVILALCLAHSCLWLHLQRETTCQGGCKVVSSPRRGSSPSTEHLCFCFLTRQSLSPPLRSVGRLWRTETTSLSDLVVPLAQPTRHPPRSHNAARLLDSGAFRPPCVALRARARAPHVPPTGPPHALPVGGGIHVVVTTRRRHPRCGHNSTPAPSHHGTNEQHAARMLASRATRGGRFPIQVSGATTRQHTDRDAHSRGTHILRCQPTCRARPAPQSIPTVERPPTHPPVPLVTFSHTNKTHTPSNDGNEISTLTNRPFGRCDAPWTTRQRRIARQRARGGQLQWASNCNAMRTCRVEAVATPVYTRCGFGARSKNCSASQHYGSCTHLGSKAAHHPPVC